MSINFFLKKFVINITYLFWWSIVSCYFHFLFSFDCYSPTY
jgi:hypothetical protein